MGLREGDHVQYHSVFEPQYTYMPGIRVKEDEPFDVAIRRFRRACERSGVLSEARRREYYEKPTEVRKRKAAAAIKRNAKRLSKQSRPRYR